MIVENFILIIRKNWRFGCMIFKKILKASMGTIKVPMEAFREVQGLVCEAQKILEFSFKFVCYGFGASAGSNI